MKKNYMNVLIVIGVLVVIVAGVSFAYFVVAPRIEGNGTQVGGNTERLLKVTYDAGSSKLIGTGLNPKDKASKTFKVKVTPGSVTNNVMYGIKINITENTFVKCDESNYDEITNACSIGAAEIIYTLKDGNGNIIKSGDLTGKTGEVILAKEEKTVTEETEYNYTLEIEFKDTGKDQNHNQNKVINGEVSVEFTEITARDVILAGRTKAERGEITAPLTSNGNTVYYEAEDDDGVSQYLAGNVTNNWVQFAGFYWRIIRINGDGTIRMIYNGTSTTITGTGTQLQTSAYNSSYNDNAYVGYMYGSTGASTYAATHANTNNSTIKGIVDSWYKTNIADKGYGNKVSTDAGFCNDRSIASSSQTWWSSDTKKGYGTNATAYAPWSRTLNSSGSWLGTQTPKFGCTNASSDLFTVSGASKGNKKLTYPVGLITMDEVVFAGGFGGTANSSYYLYTNQAYWTMSPYGVNTNGYAYVFRVRSDGRLDYPVVDGTLGVRPVINLATDVKITGNGTVDSPYKIVD